MIGGTLLWVAERDQVYARYFANLPNQKYADCT